LQLQTVESANFRLIRSDPPYQVPK